LRISRSTRRVISQFERNPVLQLFYIAHLAAAKRLSKTFENFLPAARYIGWRRCLGCLTLQVSFCKRATNYRALLQNMAYKDKASYASSNFLPAARNTGWRRCIGCLTLQVSFCKRAINNRALLQNMTYKDKASSASSPPCTTLGMHAADYIAAS